MCDALRCVRGCGFYQFFVLRLLELHSKFPVISLAFQSDKAHTVKTKMLTIIKDCWENGRFLLRSPVLDCSVFANKCLGLLILVQVCGLWYPPKPLQVFGNCILFWHWISQCHLCSWVITEILLAHSPTSVPDIANSSPFLKITMEKMLTSDWFPYQWDEQSDFGGKHDFTEAK